MDFRARKFYADGAFQHPPCAGPKDKFPGNFLIFPRFFSRQVVK